MTTSVMSDLLAVFAAEAMMHDDCATADRWYAHKGAWVQRHAREVGVPKDAAIAAYAVLSTNSTVAANDRNYLRWLRGEVVGHFGDVLRRLDLARWGDVGGALTYKQGRKVVTFAQNLMHPRTDGAVTLDRHAVRILTGGCAACAKGMLSRKRGYDQAERVYLDVGRRPGLDRERLAQSRTQGQDISAPA